MLPDEARQHLDWVIGQLEQRPEGQREIGLDRLIDPHDAWGHQSLADAPAYEVAGYLDARPKLQQVVPSTIVTWRYVGVGD